MLQKVNVIDPKKRKPVLAGYYCKEKNYFVKLATSKHFMIKEQGYGIQEDIISLLKVYDCQTIIIQTKTMILKSELSKWLEKGKVKNYGHGKQRFLPVKEMQEIS